MVVAGFGLAGQCMPGDDAARTATPSPAVAPQAHSPSFGRGARGAAPHRPGSPRSRGSSAGLCHGHAEPFRGPQRRAPPACDARKMSFGPPAHRGLHGQRAGTISRSTGATEIPRGTCAGPARYPHVVGCADFPLHSIRTTRQLHPHHRHCSGGIEQRASALRRQRNIRDRPRLGAVRVALGGGLRQRFQWGTLRSCGRHRTHWNGGAGDDSQGTLGWWSSVDLAKRDARNACAGSGPVCDAKRSPCSDVMSAPACWRFTARERKAARTCTSRSAPRCAAWPTSSRPGRGKYSCTSCPPGC